MRPSTFPCIYPPPPPPPQWKKGPRMGQPKSTWLCRVLATVAVNLHYTMQLVRWLHIYLHTTDFHIRNTVHLQWLLHVHAACISVSHNNWLIRIYPYENYTKVMGPENSSCIQWKIRGKVIVKEQLKNNGKSYEMWSYKNNQLNIIKWTQVIIEGDS